MGKPVGCSICTINSGEGGDMLSDAQIIFRLVLSVFLSGLIGLERQMHKRTAGLRTHILVSLSFMSYHVDIPLCF